MQNNCFAKFQENSEKYTYPSELRAVQTQKNDIRTNIIL